MQAISNAMTIDVEDYFQVSAFEGRIGRDDWDRHELRVEGNMDRILELLDRHDVKATFFILGWVAERYPAMVRRVAELGHEVASHGWDHTRVIHQTPEQFRADVTRTRQVLEDAAGQPLSGYRAASFSIGRSNLWALDVLGEAGYRYSSSIYPIVHDLYGMPEAPRTPFHLKPGGILEIPITTVAALGRNIPSGGGGYFRLLPYAVYHWTLSRVNGRDRMPGIFYFHPWEIDPDQPRVEGARLKSRLRHYTNLSRMQAKIERLLREFSWDRMDRVFGVGQREYPVWSP